MQKRLQIDTKTDGRAANASPRNCLAVKPQSRGNPHPFQQPLAWRLLHLGS